MSSITDTHRNSSTEFKETLVNSGKDAILVDCFSRDNAASKTLAPEVVKYTQHPPLLRLSLLKGST